MTQYGYGAPTPPPVQQQQRRKRRRWPWVVGALVVLAIIGSAVSSGGSKKHPATNGATAAISAPGTDSPVVTSHHSSAVTVPSKPTTPSLTGAQQQAVGSAREYLAMGGGFSRRGLITQLSSKAGDGFSIADATVAVNSLHEDWNRQAAISAKNYLSIEHFSCSEMVQQLSAPTGDQFTVRQAEYGARHAGIC